MDYRDEYIKNGDAHIHGGGGLLDAAVYEDWLRRVTAARTSAPPGWVAATTYFAVEDGRIVGTIQIRHELNDMLLKTGGHIGYGVRRSERGRGHATRMLALALKKCGTLGIERALVTCDGDNIASARVITKNGGVLENEVLEPGGNAVLRFWIDIKGDGRK